MFQSSNRITFIYKDYVLGVCMCTQVIGEYRDSIEEDLVVKVSCNYALATNYISSAPKDTQLFGYN